MISICFISSPASHLRVLDIFVWIKYQILVYVHEPATYLEIGERGGMGGGGGGDVVHHSGKVRAIHFISCLCPRTTGKRSQPSPVNPDHCRRL